MLPLRLVVVCLNVIFVEIDVLLLVLLLLVVALEQIIKQVLETKNLLEDQQNETVIVLGRSVYILLCTTKCGFGVKKHYSWSL